MSQKTERYPEEAIDFLEKFYKGETDPEKKFQMLLAEFTDGQHSFHSTGFKKDGACLETVDTTIQSKIGCLEYDLLIKNGIIRHQHLC
jgi:hypothetical protein